MVRIPCPQCGADVLRLVPTEPGERVTCPRCGAQFEPAEEEWVDSEDV